MSELFVVKKDFFINSDARVKQLEDHVEMLEDKGVLVDFEIVDLHQGFFGGYGIFRLTAHFSVKQRVFVYSIFSSIDEALKARNRWKFW